MRGSTGRRQPCITWLFSANRLSRHQSLHLIRIWREIWCRTWKKGHEELRFCTHGPVSVINVHGRGCHLRVTEHRRDGRKSAPVGSSSIPIYSYTHSFDAWTVCCTALNKRSRCVVRTSICGMICSICSSYKKCRDHLRNL